jgi:hypothetical protein
MNDFVHPDVAPSSLPLDMTRTDATRPCGVNSSANGNSIPHRAAAFHSQTRALRFDIERRRQRLDTAVLVLDEACANLELAFHRKRR